MKKPKKRKPVIEKLIQHVVMIRNLHDEMRENKKCSVQVSSAQIACTRSKKANARFGKLVKQFLFTPNLTHFFKGKGSFTLGQHPEVRHPPFEITATATI